LISYKEHMLKVQMELLSMKRKTSEHYLNMKQDERVRFLEGSVQWMRTEAMRLMKALERARKANHEMRLEVDQLRTEKGYMLEYNKCQKRHNLLLKKTVDSLKNPEIIKRYYEASQKSDSVIIEEEDADSSPKNTEQHLQIEINSGNFTPGTTMDKPIAASGNTSTTANNIARISTAQDSH